jgi:hypothetical protein
MKINTEVDINLYEVLDELPESTLNEVIVHVFRQRQKAHATSELIYDLCPLLLVETSVNRKAVAEQVRKLLNLPCERCGKE